MRILQHSLLFVFLVLCLSISVISQVKVSDVKLESLKGQVKQVTRTSKPIGGYAEWVLKDTTKSETTYVYNKDGELTETFHEGTRSWKNVYSKVDGYKTFKSVAVKSTNDANRFTVMGSVDKTPPIEPGEKLTEPDKRFDHKFVYEADAGGRVISERQYRNNGELFRKKTFKYDDTGFLTNETEEDSIARMTYSYKYDDKGNLVEVEEARKLKVAGSDSKGRTIYTEMKFDSKGNWIERKSTEYSETARVPKYNQPPEKYTFVNIESRTITYH